MAEENDAKQLLSLQRLHQAFFIEAYGSLLVRPKHHYALHISMQAYKESVYLDTFVHERKHRLLKQVLQHYTSLARSELQVLMKMNMLMIKECNDIKLGVSGKITMIHATCRLLLDAFVFCQQILHNGLSQYLLLPQAFANQRTLQSSNLQS